MVHSGVSSSETYIKTEREACRAWVSGSPKQRGVARLCLGTDTGCGHVCVTSGGSLPGRGRDPMADSKGAVAPSVSPAFSHLSLVFHLLLTWRRSIPLPSWPSFSALPLLSWGPGVAPVSVEPSPPCVWVLCSSSCVLRGYQPGALEL